MNSTKTQTKSTCQIINYPHDEFSCIGRSGFQTGHMKSPFKTATHMWFCIKAKV